MGWSEHIEYKERITVHTTACRNSSPGTPVCECPQILERRARTVRYPSLLGQLQCSSAMLTSNIQSTGSTNKPGSRPPGNMACILLIDCINEEARFLYATMHTVYHSRTPTVAELRTPLPCITELAMKMQDEYPECIREAARETARWVKKARVMLGYQKEDTLIQSTECGSCGGRLAVASDASTDVRCVGTDENQSCGHVYKRDQWLSLL